MHDIKFLSRYPFLKEGKEYIERKNLNLNAIVESPVYGSAIKIAAERILNGIQGKKRDSPISSNLGDTRYEIYLISFPIVKILLNLANINENLRQKYAESEGESFETLIKKESKDTQIEILKEILNFSFQKGKYLIYFVDYLTYIKNLKVKEEKFRLINRRLNSGFVEVNEDELIIIARSIVEKKYIESLNLSNINLPIPIVERAKLLKEELKKIEGEISHRIKFNFNTATSSEMPPSIAHIIQKFENNEKVSHNERFVLATFLINKGMPIEEIKKIFARSSNYNEKKTSYYLDYLAKRKYTCPSYATMKSLGIWISEEEEKFKNPLAYRKKEK